MDNLGKTKEQLITELAQLRQRIAELEAAKTKHKQTEEALQASETQYRRLFEAAKDGILILDAETGKITAVNPFLTDLLGYSQAEILGQKLWEISPFKNVEAGKANFRELQSKEYIRYEDLPLETRDGRSIAVEFVSNVYLIERQKVIQCNIRDITERKQLEAENKQLTAQFYQAQKMESIGRLAGGIAHDFNNLLVPIIGYTELGMRKLAPDSHLYANLKQIKAAGERAAELTRQILAFSRQQVLEMKTLDLNLVIGEFEPMLQRLIGEDIDLKIHLVADLPPIKADKGQLEQVVLNLVVNARDAMPDGGTLIIETVQVVLDEAYAAKHLEVQPGPQVMLAVTDTGHGMDAATQQRIFEPFFTTKTWGQGTGLGLATVFGIIKQHQGNIWVYSEPGRGTTFKIYLPVADASVSVEEVADLDSGPLQGTETVLVVEDEAGVRQLVGEMLKMHGYHVLVAGDPVEGLDLAATHEGHLDLLLTDVVMPHMNGRELYRQLVFVRPDLKVLYMSGYTTNVIVHQGVLDQGMFFLQKPFSIASLLQKVRTVLGWTYLGDDQKEEPLC